MPKNNMALKKQQQLTRYYKKYQKLKLFPSIYPSPYDSCLIYYNLVVSLTDAVATTGYFAAAYRVQRYVEHVNLRAYFGQYRVEKVTLSIITAEAPTLTAMWLATTHSADGATTAASTPTLTSIRSYRDSRMAQVNDRVQKITWSMNQNDPQEYTYRDVAAATVTADDEFAVGGPQMFASMAVGAGNIAFQLLIKYKVRYMGKQAIAI